MLLAFGKNKLGLELNKDVWEISRLCTGETRLRVLQWKILHNICPTNILLCKMKIRDDQNAVIPLMKLIILNISFLSVQLLSLSGNSSVSIY